MDKPLPPADRSSDVMVLHSAPQPITVDYAPRRMRMLYVAEHELDTIWSLGASLNIAFFGICAGIFGSFSGILLSTSIADAGKHATCVALDWAFGVLALYFAVCVCRDYRSTSKRLRDIKRGPSG